jgi:hypothetical protein
MEALESLQKLEDIGTADVDRDRTVVPEKLKKIPVFAMFHDKRDCVWRINDVNKADDIRMMHELKKTEFPLKALELALTRKETAADDFDRILLIGSIFHKKDNGVAGTPNCPDVRVFAQLAWNFDDDAVLRGFAHRSHGLNGRHARGESGEIDKEEMKEL